MSLTKNEIEKMHITFAASLSIIKDYPATLSNFQKSAPEAYEAAKGFLFSEEYYLTVLELSRLKGMSLKLALMPGQGGQLNVVKSRIHETSLKMDNISKQEIARIKELMKDLPN